MRRASSLLLRAAQPLLRQNAQQIGASLQAAAKATPARAGALSGELPCHVKRPRVPPQLGPLQHQPRSRALSSPPAPLLARAALLRHAAASPPLAQQQLRLFA